MPILTPTRAIRSPEDSATSRGNGCGHIEIESITAFDSPLDSKSTGRSYRHGATTITFRSYHEGRRPSRPIRNGASEPVGLREVTELILSKISIMKTRRSSSSSPSSSSFSTVAPSDDDESEDTRCGIGPCRPSWIQRLANKNLYIFLYSFMGFFQSMFFSYSIATITVRQESCN